MIRGGRVWRSSLFVRVKHQVAFGLPVVCLMVVLVGTRHTHSGRPGTRMLSHVEKLNENEHTGTSRIRFRLRRVFLVLDSRASRASLDPRGLDACTSCRTCRRDLPYA